MNMPLPRTELFKSRSLQPVRIICTHPLRKQWPPWGGDADFYVSLAFPLLEVYIASLGVCGLLVDQMYSYGEEREQAKNELMLLLKALGDKSKFEILYALKEAPKYNL